jgi:hypothetical protein
MHTSLTKYYQLNYILFLRQTRNSSTLSYWIQKVKNKYNFTRSLSKTFIGKCPKGKGAKDGNNR